MFFFFYTYYKWSFFFNTLGHNFCNFFLINYCASIRAIETWILLFIKIKARLNISKFTKRFLFHKKILINSFGYRLSPTKLPQLRLNYLTISILKLTFKKIFFFWLTKFKSILTSTQQRASLLIVLDFFFFKVLWKKFNIFFYKVMTQLRRKKTRRKRRLKFNKWIKRFTLRPLRRKKRLLRQTFFTKKKKMFKFSSINPKNLMVFKLYMYFYIWAWYRVHSFLFKRLRRKKRKFKRRFRRRIDRLIKFQKFSKKLLKKNILQSVNLLKFGFSTNSAINFYFPKLFKKKFNLKLYFLKKKTLHLNFIKFISIFVLNFFENYFKNKFYIIFKFFRNKRLVRVLRRQLKRVMSYQFKIGAGFFIKEMFYILWLSFKMKDLLFLVLWIKRTMERIRWRKQKIFLLALRFILRKCISPYLYFLRCYGYRCVLWGKIGVSGNSKTRNFVCRNKAYSLTTKNYKTSYEFTTINTFTGVLGLSFYLVF